MSIAVIAPDCPEGDSDDKDHGLIPSEQQKPLKSKRRKISDQDLERLAEHYRDGLNDAEACEIEGIVAQTWYQWKLRAKNKERFEHILSRMKGNRIKWCFEKIEASANKDFRAARELLALTDRERFGNGPSTSTTNNVNVFAAIGIDVTKLLAEGAARNRKAVVEVQEVKQLTAQSQADK